MKLAEDLRRAVLQAAIKGNLTGGRCEGWRFVRLGDVGRWQSGATPSKTRTEFYGGNIPWLVTGDLNDDFIDEKDITHKITEIALAKTSVKMNPRGSVLIAMYGATIGKTGILNVDATTNQACCACLPHEGVYNKYLLRLLQAFKRTFINMAAGGAQPNISKEKIIRTLIPLPPLEEQHRIVSRLDSILPLIAELEAAENELEDLKRKFPGDMRDSLLQAAIQGKLTGGNQEGWRWVRLGDIIIKDIGGGTPDKSIGEYWNGNIPWMSVKDFSRAKDGFIEDTIDHITEKGIEHSATNLIMPGAIIICMRMGLGKYARPKKPIAINQDLRAIWLSDDVLADYFLYFYSTLKIEGTGTTVKGIKRNELLSYIIPLPPLEEQKQIVSRLNELLPLCEALEKIN